MLRMVTIFCASEMNPDCFGLCPTNDGRMIAGLLGAVSKGPPPPSLVGGTTKQSGYYKVFPDCFTTFAMTK
jgi:hypothetical protein